MRAKEFITEDDKLKLDIGDSLRLFKVYPSMPANNAYLVYRFGVSMAARGQGDADSVTSQSAVVAPYTQEEDAIVAAAEAKTGHRGRQVGSTGVHEEGDVNKVSPVAKFKPTKRNNR